MERIGFAGLGTMGAAMAANLRRAGFEVTVWNRTPGRAGPLVELGAHEASTPAQAARASDVVVVCVSDTPDVEAVLFGADGIADGAQGGLVIDCSTIAPAATRGFACTAGDAGIVVDAPVSGGSEGAQKATLTIFVGGDDRGRRARPADPRAIGRRSPISDPRAAARRSRP